MSFIDQIRNQRIQVQSRNIKEGATGVSQVWDTYKEEIATIFGDNYWNVEMRPIQTNDELAIRFHDPATDGIGGTINAVCGYAEINPDYTYKSKLIRADKGYCTVDIENVKDITTAKEYDVKLVKSATLSEVYAFVKGGKTKVAVTITVADGTITIPAGTKSGEYVKVDTGLSTTAADKVTFAISAVAGETANYGIHLVGIFA